MNEQADLIVETNLMVPMRDGVRLRTDVYRPSGPGPYPVLVSRTPYGLGLPEVEQGLRVLSEAVAREGYVAILQHCRGRFGSEGEFHPGVCDIDDGYDAVEWAAVQPWSNGKVGMYGGSYQGFSQWAAAMARPPHLVCIAPLTATWNFFGSDTWYAAPGVMSLGAALGWACGMVPYAAQNRGVPTPLPDLVDLSGVPRADGDPTDMLEAFGKMAELMKRLYAHRPLRDIEGVVDLIPWWQDWCDNADPHDPYWRRLNASDHVQDLDLPVLQVSGWDDFFINGTLEAFQTMRAEAPSEGTRRAQRVIVGPWNHVGMPPARPDAPTEPSPLQLWDLSAGSPSMQFFDHHLKGLTPEYAEQPPVQLFVLGANTWREEQEWPLARTRWTGYHLHSGGSANTQDGDGLLSQEPAGDQPADSYVYDPTDPVPGPAQRGMEVDPAFDAANTGRRPDVLVYATPPLEEDVEVTGPVRLELWASSSVEDTDFTGKLVDVFPDGTAVTLCDAVVRTSFARATPPRPDTPYRYDLEVGSTSNLFRAGHRIRLDISSSAFPRFEPNPNTGLRVTHDSTGRVVTATQQVHHDRRHVSRLVLPVIPRT